MPVKGDVQKLVQGGVGREPENPPRGGYRVFGEKRCLFL